MGNLARSACPSFSSVSPDACPFSIWAKRVRIRVNTIHAVVNATIGQILHTDSAFQIASVWILQKPQTGVIELNDLQALLDQRISFCKISRCLSSGACNAVLGAVWGRPYDVPVPLRERSLVVPGHDVRDYLCAISTVPIHVYYLPSSASERFSN